MIQRSYHKKIKKDYQCKNLRNPFFHKPKKGTSKKKRFMFLALFILALLVIVWFFCFSAFWNLSKIEVTGLTRRPDGDLKQLIYNQSELKRYNFIKQKNILFFDTDAARKNILDSFNFANVEITTKWPNTIKINVFERPYAFIFQEGSANFYASSDAYLIKEMPVNTDDLQKYFVLENKAPTSVIKNNKVDIPADYLSFILNLSKSLESYPELKTEKYEIDQGYRSVNVKFVNGPTVYFNTKLLAPEQLDRLILVKKEKIKDNFNKVNYIDLRYGDRIFIN